VTRTDPVHTLIMKISILFNRPEPPRVRPAGAGIVFGGMGVSTPINNS